MAPHCDPDDTHPCFACKAAYWRRHGAPLQFTYGKDTFHGPTGGELLREGIREAKANGMTPVPHDSFKGSWPKDV